MPTPNLYATGGLDPFPDLPPALQNNKVEVLYLTDRAPTEGWTPEAPGYGHKRSRSVAFGVCELQFGQDVSWAELVKASTSAERSVNLEITMSSVAELCRFSATPKTLAESPPPVVQAQQAQEEVPEAVKRCHTELSARLAKTPVKDVYVFVHGVKTGFEGSVTTAAELWHFLGRSGVAVAYSWPAGGKGILRGYNYDYNSSEFTVYHLKEALRVIAGCPDVRNIHVIAHSRGTDVTVTAIRELHLEISGSGRVTRDVMKLGTVVLAAADLDVDVVMQRCVSARLGKVPERSLIYISAADKALGLSRLLFGGTRLGKLQPEIFTKEEIEALRKSPLAVVDAHVTQPGAYGHNYFYANPAVSSDLILVLRYGRAPGAEHGRPLEIEESGFWEIDDKYPGRDHLHPA
jgi:esterase/lipase superfamily enzyme